MMLAAKIVSGVILAGFIVVVIIIAFFTDYSK